MTERQKKLSLCLLSSCACLSSLYLVLFVKSENTSPENTSLETTNIGNKSFIGNKCSSRTTSRTYPDFSNHRCFADAETAGVSHGRSCVFHNLCLVDGAFTYFMSSNPNRTSFVYENVRPGPVRDVPGGEIVWPGRRGGIGIRQVNGQIPSDVRWFEGVYILCIRHVPWNPGHQIMDDLFPMFYSMIELLGSYDPNASVILWDDFRDDVANRLEAMYTMVFGDRVYRKEELLNQGPICFRNLLAGHKLFEIQSNDGEWNFAGKGILYRLFRDAVLKRNRIIDRVVPKNIITFLPKKSGRLIVNEDELILTLRNSFPEWIVRSVWLEPLSIEDQLSVVYESKIIISVGGGHSLFSVFLSNGAVFIYINHPSGFKPAADQPSYKLEGRYFYSHFAHLQIMYYTIFDEADVVYDREELHKKFGADFDYLFNKVWSLSGNPRSRDQREYVGINAWSNVNRRLDPGRLVDLVSEAVERTQNVPWCFANFS